jgi:putative FmdB family regulatory protein
MRAVPSTSPLVIALLATFAVVAGAIITLHLASARRWVASFGVTSTIRAPPSGSRCVSRSAIKEAYANRTSDYAGTRKERVPKMPTYEYACSKCGEHLEVVQSFRDDPLERCPSCRGRLRKVFAPVGIVFKGSGFYKTDSRDSKKSKGSPVTEKPSSESEGSSAKSDSASSASSSSETKGTKSDSKEKSSSDSSGSSGSSSKEPAKSAGKAAARS